MKISKQIIVLIQFLLISGPCWAGSYDDFFKAVQFDNPRELIQLLSRGFDPNTVDQNGTPAIVRALQEQSFKVAQVLASQPQTQVDARNSLDETALMLAALRGQASLVEQLVARGAAVNKDGWTPLHYAVTSGHLQIAAFLLGAGARVNAASPNGTTPLMMAAMYGNDACVRLLLESGADLTARNAQHLSARDFAMRAGRDDVLRVLNAAVPAR